MPEVRRLLEVALPLPERGIRERLAWSYWRRRKCYHASVTTAIGTGPSTLDPIRSIPPDLSTVVILESR